MGRHSKVAQDPKRSLAILLVTALWLAAGLFTVLTFLAATANDPMVPDEWSATSNSADREPRANRPTTPSASERSPDPSPAVSPGADVELPDSGPGITQPGILLVVSPSRGGAFDMWEQVRLPEPVDEISLTAPDVGRAGTQFEGAQPVATMVQLSADGQPIRVSDPVADGQVDVPAEGVTQFQLSYQINGTTMRSGPSTARRALAVVSPLLAEAPSDLPVAVIFNGPVLSVNCPLLDLAERSCGQGTSERIQVGGILSFDDAVITIQFDLPRG